MLNRSCKARSCVALGVALAATLALGCGDAREPNEDGPQETQSSAIGVCGPMPKVGVCDRAVCIAADRSWDIEPLAAGTKCNVTGKCDGDSNCIQPTTDPPPPPPTPRVMDFTAAEIVELQVDITGGQAITYETRNCSAGADPVLHLFKPGVTSAQRIELGSDDNGAGGVNARISLTPASGGIGFLLPRAKNDAYGTCDIYRNGYPWQYGVAVGGKTITIVGAQVNDAVETVAMPHGSEYQAIYALSGQSITQKYNPGSGTGSSARFVLGSTGASFLVHGAGPTRVVVNDVGFDSDGDGLGNRLELELGTCSVVSGVIQGFNCASIKSAKDTDGDGLSDGWEVLGKRDQFPHQLLPHWGSNPRHKDMFVEVDFLDDGQTPLRLPAQTAHVVGSYWQDTLAANSPAVQAQHAALLQNPDGLPGVSMHFDSGLPPAPGAPPEDTTLYGSWGGFDVVTAGASYPTAWQTWMSPARRGVFHWLLGVRSGSGQTSGFASIASVYNGAAIAHELGHTVGLEHFGGVSAGVLNCKPQYASPMNYAYSYQNVGFSDGVAPAPMNNRSLLEFGNLAAAPNRATYADLYERVFGYFVDRSTWSVDWDRDGDIAPSGARVRAYANSMPGGDCEGVRERRTAMTNGGVTTHAPAIARSFGKVVVFTATDSGLELRVGNDTYLNCVTAGGGDGTNPCGTFGSPSTIVSGPITGVDAVTILTPAGERVLFTFVDGSSQLRSGFVNLQSGSPSVSLTAVAHADRVLGEPAMALQNPATAVAVFRTQTGILAQATFFEGVVTTTVAPAVTSTGAFFSVTDAPGIVLGRMPGDTSDALYMQATHNILGGSTSGLLKMNDAGQWTTTPFTTAPASARPGMAYVPNPTNPAKGKLYSVYVDATSHVLRARTSGVRVTTSGTSVVRTPVFGFDSTFDNSWATGSGVDLMFEPASDSNLRAAVVYNFGTWNGKPVFQPLADGITDLTYGAFNDWGQIAEGACAAIANPGNLVASPMSCF